MDFSFSPLLGSSIETSPHKVRLPYRVCFRDPTLTLTPQTSRRSSGNTDPDPLVPPLSQVSRVLKYGVDTVSEKQSKDGRGDLLNPLVLGPRSVVDPVVTSSCTTTSLRLGSIHPNPFSST